MTLKFLKNFLQNIHKNRLLTDTILENNKNFNIIFIQESPWMIIYSIPSFISEEGKVIVEAFHYLLWTLFTRSLHIKNECPRITYINIKLMRLFLFLFFLNQQFITRRMKADHGSYFHNYVHSTQTNMTGKKKRKRKRKI